MTSDLVFDIPNDLASIDEAVDLVMRRCPRCGDDRRKLRLNLRVGLSEALANAMMYGNARDPSKRVRIEVAFRGSTITARVTDEGKGFDPCCVPDPTTPTNIMKAEGRGIFLMRKLLDEVYFNDRGNSVTLVLRLPPDAEEAAVDGGARA
jgi:anti-sigma regulatory factor (Ser/Thr protein kinase)